MADDRDRVTKLMAMATQDDSPSERDIARDKLGAMGMWPPPPRPPTRNAAGSFDSGWTWSSNGGTRTGSTYGLNVLWYDISIGTK